LNCKESGALDREVQRIAGVLQVPLSQIQPGAIQHGEFIHQPAPRVYSCRFRSLNQQRLKRRYLATVSGRVHISDIVRRQFQGIGLGLERSTGCVVSAVQNGTSLLWM